MVKRIFWLAILTGWVLGFADAAWAGWLANYTTRRKLTIDQLKVDADLTDFPVLVKLASANFDFAKANPDGFDIRFTAIDGTTLLKYERERHDSVGLKAEYWVKIPAVSGTVDTEFYIYFRTADTPDGADPTAVWDANHQAVWKMKEAGAGVAGEFKDSTINTNHGQGFGPAPTQVEAKIAQGQSFDGVDDYVDAGNDASLAVNTGTFEAWIKANPTQTVNARIVEVGENPNRVGLFLQPATTLNFYAIRGNTIIYNFPTPVTADGATWQHVVGTWDSSGAKTYVNGVEVASWTGNAVLTLPATPWSLISAWVGGAGYGFNGLIDEVRISNVARTAAWIKAIFNAGNDTLLTYGAEEAMAGISFWKLL